MLPLSFLAIGVLAYGVSAQTAAFENTTWGDVVNGQIWPIAWTEGDGHPVSLFVANNTWQWSIFGRLEGMCSQMSIANNYTANQSATPGYYEWTVHVPVTGQYHLGLVQSNQLSVSPAFEVIPIVPLATTTWTTSTTSWSTLNPTANATLIYAPIDPTVTTYWDHACGCSKTSAVASPTVTATDLPGTQYSYWDDTCNCTKSAVVPPHMGAPGSNETAPAPTAPGNRVKPPPSAATWIPSTAPATPTPLGWTGGADKLMSSSFGMVALFAAALLA